MEYRSSLGDQTFPRLLRRWDGRSIGQFESRLQGKKLIPSGGGGELVGTAARLVHGFGKRRSLDADRLCSLVGHLALGSCWSRSVWDFARRFLLVQTPYSQLGRRLQTRPPAHTPKQV